MIALTPAAASHYKPPLQRGGLAMPGQPCLGWLPLANYAAAKPMILEFPL